MDDDFFDNLDFDTPDISAEVDLAERVQKAKTAELELWLNELDQLLIHGYDKSEVLIQRSQETRDIHSERTAVILELRKRGH